MRSGPLLLAAVLAVAVLFRAGAKDELKEGFTRPPDSARPWVYWFLLDGNISREGITADLEAMKRVGIGGAVLFDVAQGMPAGPVGFNTPEWHALVRHIFSEAGRLGLKISVQDSGGWTGSGGPWITPSQSMQMLVSSKTNLSGPMYFDGLLREPHDPLHSKHFVATIAFSTLVGEGAPVPDFAPKVTASAKTFAGQNLLDHDSRTSAALPVPSSHKQQFIEFDFAKPYDAAFFKLVCAGRPRGFEGRLEVAEDGSRFRTIREFINRGRALSLEFESVKAKAFRWVFTKAEPHPGGLEFSELELAPVNRIPIAAAKAGLGDLTPAAKRFSTGPEPPGFCVINPTNIIDLSSNVLADGRLQWNVPAGLWTVLQFASVSNGRTNHPARPGAEGLECDKLSEEAVATHFHAFIDPLLKDAGTNAGNAFAGIHVDSWEIGYQNWTPGFREEFRQRCGYDPLPWLPVTSGRIVGSREQSERFLWDMRRTVADLEATNYAGELARLADEHGLKLSAQAYSSLGGGSFDELLYASPVDVPAAEFWLQDTPLDQLHLRAMPSAAHAGGKSIVAAEAFTSYPQYAKWQDHPFTLKALGDAAFCEGINRLVIHRYAHQPWIHCAPGLTLGPFGLHYERTETWWEQSRPWHEYLARCQFLLQRGLFVADVCYLTEEGAYTSPPDRAHLEPPLPQGYDYDTLAPDTLVHALRVKNGPVGTTSTSSPFSPLELPSGMSYRLLVLPPSVRMTPMLLRKLKLLVESGATVLLGPRPEKSPSLAGYPGCDAEVTRLAEELWGDCDGHSVKEHAVGKGRVICGKGLQEVFGSRIPPNFQQITQLPGYKLQYIHRRIGDAEIYFVANPNSDPSSGFIPRAECRFRVSGKRPEIWMPDSGEIRSAAEWREENGTTIVPLQFDPAGSLFVVFRNKSLGADPIVSATFEGRAAPALQFEETTNGVRFLASQAGTYIAKRRSGKVIQARLAALPAPVDLAGPWEVQFPTNSGAPANITLDHLISWTEHNNPAVRYFSGTATYNKTISVPVSFARPGRELFLDLGKVQVIAEVRVNGTNCGILWKPPYVANVSKAIRPGRNALEIRVVNLWPNRLIGDEQLPDDCKWVPAESGYGERLAEWPEWFLKGQPRPTQRKAFPAWKHWTKNSPLLESGLRGPVSLRVADEIELR